MVERCKRKALLTAAKGRAERVKAGHACSGDCRVIFMGFHEAFMGENRGTLVKPMQIILVVTVMDGNEPPVPMYFLRLQMVCVDGHIILESNPFMGSGVLFYFARI